MPRFTASPFASFIDWSSIDLANLNYLAVLQCSGLAILAMALLILMGTRWGHARPLAKCIALSVFAHVLLITYAYGTKLIMDYPDAEPESFIHLAVLQETSETESSGDPADANQLWNDFASAPIAPPVDVPQRQSLTVAVPDEPAQLPRPVHEFTSTVPAAELPAPEPVRPTPDPTVASPRDLTAAPGSAELEEVVPDSEVPNPDTAVPIANSLPRQTVTDLPQPEVAEVVPPERASEAIRELTDLTEGLRRLNDIPETTPVAPRRPGDGSPLPELYTHRSSGSRLRSLEQYGGNEKTEEAVAAALTWLAAAQSPDGHWDADRLGAGRETRVLGHNRRGAGTDADTGVTGLALLALLGAGHTHYDGEHRPVVQRALESLLRIQAADGDLAGDARLFARMYCHGIATLALSEAFALTGDERLEPYVLRAIDYSIRAQHPTTGGWRYQPGDLGDTSQFGWQVMAMKSAQLAGIRTPAETRAGMLRFLNSVSSGTNGGLASYRRGERVSPVMTAEALACRYFLDRQLDVAAIDEATQYVSATPPAEGKANLYYWYYGTLALFQVQGPAWERWNRALQRQLLSRQITRGPDAGSWAPDTVWGGYGGRVYSTAMAALCLEVYYRYLPVYEVARR